MNENKRESEARKPPPTIRRRLGNPSRRAWFGAALLLQSSFVVALIAWVVLPSAGRRIESPQAWNGTADSRSPIDAPVLDVGDTAIGPRQRADFEPVASSRPSPAVALPSRPDTLVSGRVLDADHQPIPGPSSVRVDFVDRTGRRRAFDAGPEGEYELGALAFGTHWVSVTAEGYRSESAMIDLRADQPRMRRNFTLQKAVALSVRLTTPDGKDLLEVLEQRGAASVSTLLLPVATREPLGARITEAVREPSGPIGVGRFQKRGAREESLTPDRMGVLLLDCDLPVWVSLVHDRRVLQSTSIDVGQTEVTFVLSADELLAERASIRLRVLDAVTGLPLHRTRVTLLGSTDPEVITDEHGFAMLEVRATGPSELLIRAKRHEEVRIPMARLAGGVTDLGSIALDPEIAVSGRVLGHENHPLAASFSVGVLDPTRQTVDWLRHAAFKSRGDGSFDIRGLGRGEYVIRTRTPGTELDLDWKPLEAVSGHVLLDTRTGPVAGLEIRLPPASKLVLHVSNPTESGTWFRAMDERGLELVTGRLHGSEPRAITLPPGAYRVALLDHGGAVVTERSVIVGSETLTLGLAR